MSTDAEKPTEKTDDKPKLPPLKITLPAREPAKRGKEKKA